MENKTYIEEGHYRDNNGNHYMSIWTFKKTYKINTNSNEINYSDARQINCNDRFMGPFNESDTFKKGWMYNIDCLKNFYNI